LGSAALLGPPSNWPESALKELQKDLQKKFPDIGIPIDGLPNPQTQKALERLNKDFDINKTPSKDIIDRWSR
jgi:hypothetical protein